MVLVSPAISPSGNLPRPITYSRTDELGRLLVDGNNTLMHDTESKIAEVKKDLVHVLGEDFDRIKAWELAYHLIQDTFSRTGVTSIGLEDLESHHSTIQSYSNSQDANKGTLSDAQLRKRWQAALSQLEKKKLITVDKSLQGDTFKYAISLAGDAALPDNTQETPVIADAGESLPAQRQQIVFSSDYLPSLEELAIAGSGITVKGADALATLRQYHTDRYIFPTIKELTITGEHPGSLTFLGEMFPSLTDLYVDTPVRPRNDCKGLLGMVSNMISLQLPDGIDDNAITQFVAINDSQIHSFFLMLEFVDSQQRDFFLSRKGELLRRRFTLEYDDDNPDLIIDLRKKGE